MRLVVGSSLGELDGTVIELGAAVGSAEGFKCGRRGTATEQHEGQRVADLLDLGEWSTYSAPDSSPSQRKLSSKSNSSETSNVQAVRPDGAVALSVKPPDEGTAIAMRPPGEEVAPTGADAAGAGAGGDASNMDKLEV